MPFAFESDPNLSQRVHPALKASGIFHGLTVLTKRAGGGDSWHGRPLVTHNGVVTNGSSARENKYTDLV